VVPIETSGRKMRGCSMRLQNWVWVAACWHWLNWRLSWRTSGQSERWEDYHSVWEDYPVRISGVNLSEGGQGRLQIA